MKMKNEHYIVVKSKNIDNKITTVEAKLSYKDYSRFSILCELIWYSIRNNGICHWFRSLPIKAISQDETTIDNEIMKFQLISWFGSYPDLRYVKDFYNRFTPNGAKEIKSIEIYELKKIF